MSDVDILTRIATKRRERVAAEGYSLASLVPAERMHPVVPFPRSNFVICEIKRKSPSRGTIDGSIQPVRLAGTYRELGADAISILTEEDHFGGNLTDLMVVKKTFPDLPVLRKDFLLDLTDVEYSYRAGADCILLIASLLSDDELSAMYRRASELGMDALLEVHDEREARRVAPLKPGLVGVNARDLKTFRIDPLGPVRVRHAIDWPCSVVYESGIFEEEQAALASQSGFSGVLVGESVVRDHTRIPAIKRGLALGAPPAAGVPTGFWYRLTAKRHRRPWVKVCGIMRASDAAVAVEAGADLLGFVFAESPRRSSAACVRECAGLDALKVAVVVARDGKDAEAVLPLEVQELLADGYLDAVQLHGDEEPHECAPLAFPYYKAMQLRTPDDAQGLGEFYCPRCLVDAYSRDARGGTGRRLDPEILEAVCAQGPLWVAGGIRPDNVRELVRRFGPELVDVSSGLEDETGYKDAQKIRTLFTEIEAAIAQEASV
ncbi:MAG: bifunctional indole-3-glycerol phosphate synthase/phosphoribosylanthranilate isomerase [Spirochaetaceae bacterium]|nr:MAG: bifunctional indole-3-glycerol phosphate synthase/phosphoribosylanthranilate isomerase [Spirochaetaceae bacterium]